MTATLTGAIGVALGQINAGVFSNNGEFQERLLGCARAAGETEQRLYMISTWPSARERVEDESFVFATKRRHVAASANNATEGKIVRRMRRHFACDSRC